MEGREGKEGGGEGGKRGEERGRRRRRDTGVPTKYNQEGEPNTIRRAGPDRQPGSCLIAPRSFFIGACQWGRWSVMAGSWQRSNNEKKRHGKTIRVPH